MRACGFKQLSFLAAQCPTDLICTGPDLVFQIDIRPACEGPLAINGFGSETGAGAFAGSSWLGWTWRDSLYDSLEFGSCLPEQVIPSEIPQRMPNCYCYLSMLPPIYICRGFLKARGTSPHVVYRWLSVVLTQHVVPSVSSHAAKISHSGRVLCEWLVAALQ